MQWEHWPQQQSRQGDETTSKSFGSTIRADSKVFRGNGLPQKPMRVITRQNNGLSILATQPVVVAALWANSSPPFTPSWVTIQLVDSSSPEKRGRNTSGKHRWAGQSRHARKRIAANECAACESSGWRFTARHSGKLLWRVFLYLVENRRKRRCSQTCHRMCWKRSNSKDGNGIAMTAITSCHKWVTVSSCQ